MSVFTISERCSHRYTAVVQDETGTPIPAASLSTLKLTLYDKKAGTIINGRDEQNVLNANGVTVDSSGNLVWTISPADAAHVAGDGQVEVHVALFEFTYAAGAKAGNHQVFLHVQDLARVP